MISDDSLLTIVAVCLVPQDRHGDAAAEVRSRFEVEFAQDARAEDRIGDDAPALVEGPAAGAQQPMDDRERYHALEPLEPAEDEGAVRPRAGERDDEVVAARLSLEAAGAAWSRFAARRHPVAERRIWPDEMARPVVRKVALRAPCSLHEFAHVSSSPAPSLRGAIGHPGARHPTGYGDEAIQHSQNCGGGLDCFASLAMTIKVGDQYMFIRCLRPSLYGPPGSRRRTG